MADTKSLIFGVTGQDGTHLSKHLTDRGDKVFGVHRRVSISNLGRLKQSGIIANPNLTLIEGDISDSHCVASILNEVQPDEIYNVAAQSHVKTSFRQPKYTNDVNYVGVLNVLEWVRGHKNTKLYHSSTSEMFGNSVTVFDPIDGEYNTTFSEYEAMRKEVRGLSTNIYQSERTPFAPQSPYAISKLAAHQLCELYKNSYDLKVWSGILFNHEGEYRGEEFVTRKITKWCAEFRQWIGSFPFNKCDFDGDYICNSGNIFPKLRLGNIYAARDWGYAGEYTKLMMAMLQSDVPDTYVVATGETVTVYDFMIECFKLCNFPENFWGELYIIDPKFYRPSEVPYLRGDSSKIQKALMWKPEINYKRLAEIMINHDTRRVYSNS